MEAITLSAAKRDATRAGELRRSGRVPGVVYGNADNMTIHCDRSELRKAYTQAGESTVVHLDIDGKTIPVLFHVIDLHPVSDLMIHVDFYAVDMKKEVEAEVHIRFEGEAPAVKELGAVLLHTMDTITVRALPANLPHDLPLDLSKLTELDAALHVSDILAPQGVEILDDPETAVVIAQPPRAEEPEEAPAAAEEGAEGTDEEGKEGAEGEEGKAEGGEKKE